jgi:hypothetical protein
MFDKTECFAKVTIKGRRALNWDGVILAAFDDKVVLEWHDAGFVARARAHNKTRILPTAPLQGFRGHLYPDDPRDLAKRLGFYKGAIITTRSVNGAVGPGSMYVL